MARGRAAAAWEQTSLLCAVLVNANPFREGEPVSPAVFNPYASEDGPRPPNDAPELVVPLAMLKANFIRNGWE